MEKLEDADHDVRIPWTFKYVGYARTAAGRFATYRDDKTQSWLTELVRNAFQYTFPDRGFKLDAYVIYFCISPQECEFDEEILSRCGQAYLETGTGFGVTPAGVSVKSANETWNYTNAQAQDLWKRTMRFRLNKYVFYT